MDGGLKRLWLDLPPGPTLYANQLGGFRVRCPIDGGTVAGTFGAALQAWRSGGPFSMPCPSCDETHSLDTLSMAPPGGFASGAIVFADVGSAALRSGVLPSLEAIVGPTPRVVLRRAV